MVKHREILRLAAMGVRQNSIAFSCGCAQSTASDVLRAARARKVSWPLVRGDGRCGDKVRHPPHEGVPRARQGPHRPREDRLRAPQAGDDDVASLERVLRFHRRQGRGTLHVLGVLQEAPRMGCVWQSNSRQVSIFQLPNTRGTEHARVLR